MPSDIIFPNIGIEFQTINRIAFSIFGFDLYWYAIFVFFGIIAGIFFGAYLSPKLTKQDPNSYFDFAIVAVPACIIGARLFYVAFNWGNFSGNFFSIFNLRDGGLAIFGVILAAIITSVIWTKKKKINWFLFADTAVVGLIIGHVIGRFGNFVNREAFGGYTNGLFAMQIRIDQVFSQSSITSEMLDNIVLHYGINYISVHPTFLYEASINFALFIFLNIYRKYKKFNGELLAFYFLVYGIARFFIEGLRTDQLMFFNIAISQFMAALFAIIGAVILIKGYIKIKK